MIPSFALVVPVPFGLADGVIKDPSNPSLKADCHIPVASFFLRLLSTLSYSTGHSNLNQLPSGTAAERTRCKGANGRYQNRAEEEDFVSPKSSLFSRANGGGGIRLSAAAKCAGTEADKSFR